MTGITQEAYSGPLTPVHIYCM